VPRGRREKRGRMRRKIGERMGERMGEGEEMREDGSRAGGDDGVTRVKLEKQWWGEYEKNHKIAWYCSTVKQTICTVKRWFILLNVPLMSHLKIPKVEALVKLCCALTNLQIETGNFMNW
jgi:hypothetical protein